MVGTALTIERERSRMLGALRMRVLVERGMRVSFLLVWERSRGLLVHEGSKATASGRGRDQGYRSGWADGVLPLPAARIYEERLPLETGIPRFWDSVVPVSSIIGEDTIYSSTARYRQENPASVSGSCTGTSCYTGKPERLGYGPRQNTRPTGRDVTSSGACLCHHTIG